MSKRIYLYRKGGVRILKKVIIHYPTDENGQIAKEIAAFRRDAVVKYIESLNLNDRQIETLYAELAKIISVKQRKDVSHGSV